MNLGWISLHRKILDNPILSRGRIYSRFEAFVYMLLKANHKENKCVIGNQLIQVKTGSFITSQKKLMSEFKWGISKLRGFLELLQKDNMITITPNSFSTMITIINYDTYQSNQIANKTQIKTNQTINKLPVTTNNNTNKINNKNKLTEKVFIDQVMSIVEKNNLEYTSNMIKEFCDYWTEKNVGAFKMRFEKQTSFDISRRLKRWYNNSIEWDTKPKAKYQYEDFKFDSSGYNKLAYCSKCNTSDFYKKPQYEDSRCCNSELNPRKQINE